MQGGGARAELLEDGQVDAVGVQLERHRQMLEPDDRVQELVEKPCARPEYVHCAGGRLGVGRNQQAHPYAGTPAEPLAAGQEEHQRRQRVLGVGCALQNPAALAQHGDQLAAFPPRREGRRQRPRPVAVTVELVDGRVHPGHSEQARRRAPLRAARPSGRVRRPSGFTPSVVARSRPSTVVRRSE